MLGYMKCFIERFAKPDLLTDMLTFLGLFAGIFMIYLVAYSIGKNHTTISIVFIIITASLIGNLYGGNDLIFLVIPYRLMIFILNVIVLSIFATIINRNREVKLNSGDVTDKGESEKK